MNRFNNNIPLSLYIHMPWCIQKCPYCDFNSHRLKDKDALPETQYIDLLIKDLEKDLPLVWGRTVQSIFIGGGTPSLISPAEIERLLLSIRSLISVSPNAEITMEANPGTVEQHRFEGYRAAGVNRLSLGIQSFHDEHLSALGRIHNSTEAIKAIETTKAVGFENFNLDLMFGLPNQSIEQALNDLKRAIALGPAHISWYQLTIEPNTLFYHQTPKLPHDDKIWDMQLQGQALLDEAGFKQYEVSAYARDQKYCQHNMNYWTFGDYLGIGAGAHGKITDINDQKMTRYWKVKHPKTYLQTEHNFIGGQHTIELDDIVFEFMINALRLSRPISFDLFSERTGLNPEIMTPQLIELEKDKLIIIHDDHFQPSDLGRRYLNDVLERFLIDKQDENSVS